MRVDPDRNFLEQRPQSPVAVPTTEMLEGYFLGTISSDEKALVREWAASELGSVTALQSIRKMRAEAPSALRDPQQSWSVLERAMDSTASDLSEPIQPSVRKKGTGVLSRVASMSVGVIAAALLLIAGWFAGSGNTSRSFSDRYTIYSTASGERATVNLPDGSQVLLSVSSELRVPADFGSEHGRDVYLEGEAVFTVDHHAGAPFTVVSGAGITRVLGTRFLVRSYRGEGDAVVAVDQGRVSVEEADAKDLSGSRMVVVDANQEVPVMNGQLQTVQLAETNRFTVIDGILTLGEMPLIEVVRDLERWYNVDIRFADQELENKRVKGAFSHGSVTDLVEILEWTFDLRVDRRDKTLHLYLR